MTECPGTGRKWGFGTGRPICPVCRTGITKLTGKQVTGTYSTALRGAPKVVPAHEARSA